SRDAIPPVGDPDGDCIVIDGNEEEKRIEKAKKDKELAKKVMTASAIMVKASNGLPKTGDNYELLRSFSSFSQLIEKQENRVVNLISSVLSTAGSRVRLPRIDRRAEFEHFYDRVIEANDEIVERAGIVLDEMERTRRGVKVTVPRAVIDAESTRRSLASDMGIRSSAGLGAKLSIGGGENVAGSGELHTKKQRDQARIARVSATTTKPQKAFGFGESIDNSSDKYLPILKKKHHETERKKTEGLVVRDEVGESINSSRAFASDEAIEAHPYSYELDHDECPADQLESREPEKYGEMESTELIVVDTLEGLKKLVDTLNKEKEFAVDLEAHSHRSFCGLVCLMQISTRTIDVIVDPFPIWNEMHLLNEPFSDPNILKVFHGADYDVIWLQRDFNIFVRNVFDTYRAMKRDGTWTKFSLAALVHDYCGVQLQKEYQLADWRVRPLPADYVEYARGDTHYLLYCKDKLREKLLETGNDQANLLRAVYADGIELTRKLFEKPLFDSEGYRSLIGTRKNFNNRQLHALAELWRWRDATAREEDESTAYVLPNHMMIHIAEALPREMQGILACCSPVPLLVKQHLLQLHRIIYAARDRPLEKTVTLSSRAIGTDGGDRGLFEAMIDEANRMTKVKSVLRSSLDFTHCAYNEEIGSMLGMREEDKIGVNEKEVTDTFLSVIGVFKVEEEEKGKIKEKKKEQKKKVDGQDSIIAQLAAISTGLEEWATPYERYTIAVQENEKKREAARIAEELKRKERGNVDKEGRQLYSHHDPVVSRKPVFKTESDEPTIDINKTNDGEANDEGEVLTGDGKGLKKSTEGKWDEHQVLTKKKLKMMEKKRKAAADWSVEGPSEKKKEKMEKIEGGKKPAKKEEEEDGEVEEEEERQPFQYGDYDAKALFEQNQKEANERAYNPMGGVARGMEKARGRGAKRGKHGGHTRAVGKSVSFGGRGGRGGGGRGRDAF
ncbi:hypothetical protein PFISCL1PPCAC_5631, partial [Pristionchus fissidentatus]